MQTHKFENLDSKVKVALEKFIKPFRNDPKVQGILLVGSYALGDYDEHSDLDVCIVYDNLDWRERGNTWIDGYEIEYFINPQKQIYNYMETEDILRPNTAHMYANGIVLFKRDKDLDKIIKKAKEIIETPLLSLTNLEIELAKYAIDDMYKDLLGAKTNSYVFRIVANQIIEYSINIFCRLNHSTREKPKRLFKQIQSIDKQFYELLKRIFESNFNIQAISKMIIHLEEKLGGKREKEWKLRGELTIKE